MQSPFSREEFAQLHAAIKDIAMTVKQLRRQAEENALILSDMWSSMDAVKRATVPPQKVSPHLK